MSATLEGYLEKATFLRWVRYYAVLGGTDFMLFSRREDDTPAQFVILGPDTTVTFLRESAGE
jgi:hypothetical protein